jgi:hypothetical protein
MSNEPQVERKINIPYEQWVFLHDYAEEKGITIGEVISTAVHEYLDWRESLEGEFGASIEHPHDPQGGTI